MRIASLLAAALALLATTRADAAKYTPVRKAPNSWTSHVAVQLKDGRVLVAGGTDAGPSAALWDPATNTWTATSSMSGKRLLAGAARLSDGRVLVVGGYGEGGLTSSSEVFDPSTSLWSSGPSTAKPRLGPAFELSDGSIVAPDAATAAMDTLGSSLSTWKRHPFPPEFSDACVAPLPGGSVLACSLTTSQCARWNPVDDNWTTTAALPSTGSYALLAPLADGRVLLAGSASSAIYSPIADAWSPLVDAAPRGSRVLTASLPKIAVVLGDAKGGTEVLRLSTGKLMRFAGLPFDLTGASATPLADGRVLVLLGAVGYTFDPPAYCEADSDCASGFCTDGVCCDRRCDGQCEACDVDGYTGVCSPVFGAPHGDRPLCSPAWTPACRAKTCVGSVDARACQPRSGTAPCDCARDDECDSGHCVDGVCCDTACEGQCEACDLPSHRGVCSPVLGEPRGNRRGCTTGKSICSVQSCDGVHTGACRLKNGAGTSCGMTCGQLQHCDDEGGCGLPHELQCPTNCSTSPRETTAPPSWFDALFVVAAATLLARTRRPSR